MPTNFKGTPQHGGNPGQVWGKVTANDDDSTWISAASNDHVGDSVRFGSPLTAFVSGADTFVPWNLVPSRVVGDTFSVNPSDHTQIICSRAALVVVQGYMYWDDVGHATGTRYMELLVGANPPGSFHDLIEDSCAPADGTIQSVNVTVPFDAGDCATMDVTQSCGITLDPVFPAIQLAVLALL